MGFKASKILINITQIFKMQLEEVFPSVGAKVWTTISWVQTERRCIY